MARSRCSERSDRKKSIRDEYDDKLDLTHEAYLDAAVLPSFHILHTKMLSHGLLRNVPIILITDRSNRKSQLEMADRVMMTYLLSVMKLFFHATVVRSVHNFYTGRFFLGCLHDVCITQISERCNRKKSNKVMLTYLSELTRLPSAPPS